MFSKQKPAVFDASNAQLIENDNNKKCTNKIMLPTKLTKTVILGRVLSRHVSQQAHGTPAFDYHRSGFQSRMTGWELHEYGNFAQVLEMHNNLRIPKIEDPHELIVRVRAASVNPLDLAMAGNRTFEGIN